MPAPSHSYAGTASQLIPGVRRTIPERDAGRASLDLWQADVLDEPMTAAQSALRDRSRCANILAARVR
jgi:hypothetical protein